MKEFFFFKKKKPIEKEPEGKGIARRDFVMGVGAAIVGAGVINKMPRLDNMLVAEKPSEADYFIFAQQRNEEMKARGIISEYENLYAPRLSENMYDMVTPRGYSLGNNLLSQDLNHLEEIINALKATYEKKVKAEVPEKKEGTFRENLWKMILGMPQDKKTLPFLVSPRQPSIKKNQLSPYLCFRNSFFEQLILEQGLSLLKREAFQQKGKSNGNAQELVIGDTALLDVLGQFKLSYVDKDADGRAYFSYYDIWDINPLGIDEKKLADRGVLTGIKSSIKLLLQSGASIQSIKEFLEGAAGEKVSQRLRFISDEEFQELEKFFKQRDDKELDEILEFLLMPRKVEIYNRIYFDPATGKRILDKPYENLLGNFENNTQIDQRDKIFSREVKVVFVNDKFYFFNKQTGLPVDGVIDFQREDLQNVRVEKGELSKEDAARHRDTEQCKKMKDSQLW